MICLLSILRGNKKNNSIIVNEIKKIKLVL
jgi:hypothetical protein